MVWGNKVEGISVDNIKLVLRDVLDITKEEEIKYKNLLKNISYHKNGKTKEATGIETIQSFHFLIKNKFDCFNLLDNKFAVNVKKCPYQR